jgi:hypothetical protein
MNSFTGNTPLADFFAEGKRRDETPQEIKKEGPYIK